jgi:hypothetical protein
MSILRLYRLSLVMCPVYVITSWLCTHLSFIFTLCYCTIVRNVLQSPLSQRPPEHGLPRCRVWLSAIMSSETLRYISAHPHQHRHQRRPIICFVTTWPPLPASLSPACTLTVPPPPTAGPEAWGRGKALPGTRGQVQDRQTIRSLLSPRGIPHAGGEIDHVRDNESRGAEWE